MKVTVHDPLEFEVLGTGLGFTESGPAIVPGALSPVHVSLEQDHAVYVEPNLWVHHRLG